MQIIEQLTTALFFSDFRLERIQVSEQGKMMFEQERQFSNNPIAVLETYEHYLNNTQLFFHIHFKGISVDIKFVDKFHYFILEALVLDSVYNSYHLMYKNISANRFHAIFKDKLASLYQVWKGLTDEEALFIIQLFMRHRKWILIFIRSFNIINKYERNGKLVQVMLDFESSSSVLPIELGTRIALYGSGNIGLLFETLLRKRGYTVAFFIDNHTLHREVNGVPIIKSHQMSSNNVDLIVVTPVYDLNRIEVMLRDVCDTKILPLDQIMCDQKGGWHI